MPRQLTRRQQRFVEEYLVDLNATAAAIRAGYSVKTAGDIASRLVGKSQIKEAIDKALAIRSRRTGISQNRVLLELARIALVNAADVINMDEATVYDDANREDTAAVASVRVKTIPTKTGNITEREVKLHDKLKALELLGKHLGMFKDRVDVSVDVNLAELLEKVWSGQKRDG